jgi:hypothetical protein
MIAMKKLSMTLIGAAVIAFGTGKLAQAASFTIPINTGTSGKPGLNFGAPDPSFTWNYTGNFSDSRYQSYTHDAGHTWIMNGGDLFSDNNYGSDVPSDLPDFQGVVFLYYTFELSQNATNVQLDFSTIAANDRVVASLNGTQLGGFKLWSDDFPIPVQGIMTNADFSNVPMTFKPNGTPVQIHDQSLFNFGGQNVLTFWVNDTGVLDPNAPATSVVDGPGGGVLAVSGTLSYEITAEPKSVPEPSTILGSATAIGFVALFKREHSKRQKKDQ